MNASPQTRDVVKDTEDNTVVDVITEIKNFPTHALYFILTFAGITSAMTILSEAWKNQGDDLVYTLGSVIVLVGTGLHLILVYGSLVEIENSVDEAKKNGTKDNWVGIKKEKALRWLCIAILIAISGKLIPEIFTQSPIIKGLKYTISQPLVLSILNMTLFLCFIIWSLAYAFSSKVDGKYRFNGIQRFITSDFFAFFHWFLISCALGVTKTFSHLEDFSGSSAEKWANGLVGFSALFAVLYIFVIAGRVHKIRWVSWLIVIFLCAISMFFVLQM